MKSRKMLDPSMDIIGPGFSCAVGLARGLTLGVLHVDDDLCFLEVSKQILSVENNFEIDTAPSVDEAFKKMETHTYDPVVSDFEMPQKNGLEFLKELTTLELNSNGKENFQTA